jgi:quercetin dioxygenase-like cupin family protein
VSRTVFSVDAADVPAEGWDDPARGSIRWQTLMSQGLTPTRSMVCGIAHLAEGETFARHHHPEDEVYFGLAGEGTVMIGGQPHPIAPGVAIFIPGGVEHGIDRADTAFSYFYVFAADRFEDIVYTFPAAASRPA